MSVSDWKDNLGPSELLVDKQVNNGLFMYTIQ